MRIGPSLGRDLLIVPILLAAVASSACVRSSEAKSAAAMEAGKKLLEQKDVARAILQFRNAVQATPRNPEAYYQLAIASLAAGDIQPGILTLRRTLELDPKHVGAQLRLAQLMASTTDLDVLKDAQGRLKTLLQDYPQNAEALHALGIAEFKLGSPAVALQHLELAAANAPRELLFAITLAQTKVQQGDPRGAEDVLRKACDNSPALADGHTALADFYISQKKADKAETELRRALELDANNGPARITLARLQLSGGRKEEAEQNFKRLVELRGYESAYGTFLSQDGRLDQSLQEFERLAKEHPDDREIRTNLVALYRRSGRLNDAKKVLSEALKKNPKDLEALLQQGELFIGAGEYSLAEANLNRVLKLQPNSAEIHYIVARLKREQGRPLIYREELSKALELNPSLLPIRLEAAQELVSSNNANAALRLLDQTPESQKEMTAVLIQKNWALLSLGRMAEMRAGIDQGLAHNKSPDLLIQDGVWKLRSGQTLAARTALESALNLNPADLRALQALQGTYGPKEARTALQKVKEYAAREPNSAPIQDFLGVLLMGQRDLVGARKAFAAAKAANPKFVNAELSLVQLDVLDGKLDDARNRLTTLDATGQSTASGRLWLGILENRRGNHAAAIEQLRKALEIEPENPQALNNLAYLLAETGRTDEALKYAQKAVELDPASPDYSDTLGWVLYRKGLYGAAVPYFERAGNGKGNAVWKYHLAMAYAKSGNPVLGRAALADALKINPRVPEANLAKEILNGLN